MVALQGSLLDLVEEPGPRPLGPCVQRTALSNGAWIDVRPAWMAGAEGLFDRLSACVPWKAERRRMYDRVVDVPRKDYGVTAEARVRLFANLDGLENVWVMILP